MPKTAKSQEIMRLIARLNTINIEIFRKIINPPLVKKRWVIMKNKS